MHEGDTRDGVGGWGVRPGAFTLGWVVAALAGIVVSVVLRVSYAAVTGFPIDRGELTLSLVAVSLVAGFLAYLAGGYAAARVYRRSGGANGAAAAVLGLFVGTALSPILLAFGITFAEGVAIPPACFGLAADALLAGLALFMVNLFGGYVGGTLGEPP